MQLRVWGTERAYPLPPQSAREFLIGSSLDCWLQLRDQEGFVSRRHAALEMVDGSWRIVDKRSKNGVWVDGNRVDCASLMGGTEIALGRVVLVVETPRTMRIRALLARFLGWAESKRVVVDRAMRVMRGFLSGTMPVWLAGSDDLTAIARALHLAARGEGVAFDVVEPDDLALLATEHISGTLCVSLPPRATSVLVDVPPPSHVIACTPEVEVSTAIRVPPVHQRLDEAERLAVEYGIDALIEMNANADSFPAVDRDWIVAHLPATHGELQTVARRLVAIRALGGINAAADYLEISHSALSRWYSRRMRRGWRS